MAILRRLVGLKVGDIVEGNRHRLRIFVLNMRGRMWNTVSICFVNSICTPSFWHGGIELVGNGSVLLVFHNGYMKSLAVQYSRIHVLVDLNLRSERMQTVQQKSYVYFHGNSMIVLQRGRPKKLLRIIRARKTSTASSGQALDVEEFYSSEHKSTINVHPIGLIWFQDLKLLRDSVPSHACHRPSSCSLPISQFSRHNKI